jgi:hypothetical protein
MQAPIGLLGFLVSPILSASGWGRIRAYRKSPTLSKSEARTQTANRAICRISEFGSLSDLFRISVFGLRISCEVTFATGSS